MTKPQRLSMRYEGKRLVIPVITTWTLHESLKCLLDIGPEKLKVLCRKFSERQLFFKYSVTFSDLRQQQLTSCEEKRTATKEVCSLSFTRSRYSWRCLVLKGCSRASLGIFWMRKGGTRSHSVLCFTFCLQPQTNPHKCSKGKVA